ncbi:hypothetical protein OH687_18660 [Burkholderia anthina]|nr:hypothetical protein OH687_18660 [Burkholderia anthina]
MHHGDLQGKRIIFIVTINFIDGCAGNPCRSVVTRPSLQSSDD